MIPRCTPSPVTNTCVDALAQGLAFANKPFGFGIVGLVLVRDASHRHICTVTHYQASLS